MPDLPSSILKFGSYEVLTNPDGTPCELGSGGFGRTYRARHRLLKTEVALKVIHDKHAFDDKVKARFIREAQEQANLVHPGIARIMACDETDDGTLYYVMDLCEGGDLQHFIEKVGPLDTADALYLLEQSAEAICFAHEKGLIHRDIKPSNLLLVFSDEGMPQLKLIDFGLVKRIGKSAHATGGLLTQDGQANFTPAFASPEQMREQTLDARSDIFSLGMTFWFLLTAQRGPEGSSAEIVSDRVNTQEYDRRLPSTLPPSVKGVLARMIRKIPADRYQSGAELVEDIKLCRRSFPIKPSDWRVRQRQLSSFTSRYSDPKQTSVSALGKIYRARDVRSEMEVEVALLPAQTPLTALPLQAAKRLVEAKPPGVVMYIEVEQYAEGWVISREHPNGTSLLDLMRQHGATTFTKALPLFGELANAFDGLLELRVPSAESHPSQIILFARASSIVGRQTAEFDWQGWRPKLLPQLSGQSHSADPSLTAVDTLVSGEGSFLAAFGILIYYLVGGNMPPAAARLEPSLLSRLAGLEETSNRLLAQAIAGSDEWETCNSLLQKLKQVEGVSENHLEKERRRALWEMFTGLITTAQERYAELKTWRAEIQCLTQTCPDLASLDKQAAQLEKAASKVEENLFEEALPETASSTILYATLTDGESTAATLESQVSSMQELLTQAHQIAAEYGENERLWQASLASASKESNTSLSETETLLQKLPPQAQELPECAEALTSLQQWHHRLYGIAQELTSLAQQPPVSRVALQSSNLHLQQLQSQAKQGLEQLRGWARQASMAAQQVLQQRAATEKQRQEILNQRSALSQQALTLIEEIRTQHTTCQAIAKTIPAAKAHAQQAQALMAQAEPLLANITASPAQSDDGTLQASLIQAQSRLETLRGYHNQIYKLGSLCESLQRTEAEGHRRQEEQIITHCRQSMDTMNKQMAEAQALVAETDAIALKHEPAGVHFVAAQKAFRELRQKVNAAQTLTTQIKKGTTPADAQAQLSFTTWNDTVSAEAKRITSHCDQARLMAASAEQERHADNREREAVKRTLSQCAEQAATAIDNAKKLVYPDASNNAISSEAAAQLRKGNQLLRRMEESVSQVDRTAPEQLAQLATEAPTRLQEVAGICAEIAQLCKPTPAPPKESPLPRKRREATLPPNDAKAKVIPLPPPSSPEPGEVGPIVSAADSGVWHKAGPQVISAPEPIVKPKSKLPLLLAIGGLAAAAAAGFLFWQSKAPIEKPGDKPIVLKAPPVPEQAFEMELQGDFPIDIAAFRKKIVVTSTSSAALERWKSEEVSKNTLKISGLLKLGPEARDQGILDVALPAGYLSLTHIEVQKQPTLDVTRTTGAVNYKGTLDPLYSRIIFVWKGPLPDEPLATPPRWQELPVPLSASFNPSLPTGLYDLFLDDDQDNNATPTPSIIERRKFLKIEVKKEHLATPLIVDLPSPLPKLFEGSVLVTQIPNEKLGDTPGPLKTINNLPDYVWKQWTEYLKTQSRNSNVSENLLAVPFCAGKRWDHWKYPRRLQVAINAKASPPTATALFNESSPSFQLWVNIVNDVLTLESYIYSLKTKAQGEKIVKLFATVLPVEQWNSTADAEAAVNKVLELIESTELRSMGDETFGELITKFDTQIKISAAEYAEKAARFNDKSATSNPNFKVSSITFTSDDPVQFVITLVDRSEQGVTETLVISSAEDGIFNVKGDVVQSEFKKGAVREGKYTGSLKEQQ